jgi:hypothetical protein
MRGLTNERWEIGEKEAGKREIKDKYRIGNR